MRNILYFLNPVRLFRRFVIRRGNLNRFRNLVNRSETTGGMTENKSNDGMSVDRGIKKYEKRILLAKGKKKRNFFNLKNSIILIILFMTFVYIHFSGYSIKSMYVSIFIFIAITLYLLIVERFNEKVNFENEIREIKNERTKEHDVFLEKVKDIEQLEKNQLENIILKNCDDYDIKVWKIGRATSLLLGKKTPRNKVDIDVGEKIMKNKKLYIFIGIILLLLVANHFLGFSKYFTSGKLMEDLQVVVKQNLALAILIYVIATVVGCVVLALPGISFAVIAGVLFGPWLGTVCCIVAVSLGAMASFLAGRYFLQDSIRPLAMKNTYIRKWLFEGGKQNKILILMITRLLPIFPYNLQNFAYGITDIGFIDFSIYSFIFMLPGTAMYTIASAGVASQKNRWFYIAIAVVIALALFPSVRYMRRKYIEK